MLTQASCCTKLLVVGRSRGRDHSDASVVFFFFRRTPRAIYLEDPAKVGFDSGDDVSPSLLVRKSNTMPKNWNTRACLPPEDLPSSRLPRSKHVRK